MRIADEIHSALTMQQVAEFYGFEVNRGGYINCPFHSEDTPSLKIYAGNGGFHCFGCGAHGDVIKFVMMLFNLSFAQAVIRLSSDFGLGLTPTRETPREARERIRAREEAAKAKQREEAEYLKKAQEHCHWWNIAKEHAPARENMDNPDFEFDDLYVEALHRLPSLEYWLDEHLGR